MDFPRFVLLQSYYDHKYLHYTEEDGMVHRFLQFKGEDVVSPLAKYELVKSTNGKKGLVHIRCCFNNCYWVRGPGDEWIRAASEKPEEDESNPSCTLFEPVVDDGTTTKDAKTVRFRHVHSGNNACWRASEPQYACLYAGNSDHDKDRCDVITITNWESVLVLPKHVAFKGQDGYLSAQYWEGDGYLYYVASTNIEDPTVWHEVFTNSDGSIRIKSDYVGKFWRVGPKWIMLDSDDSTNNNPETLFRPIKVDNNGYVLRSLSNNNLCKVRVDYYGYNCLSVGTDLNVDVSSRLEVVEPVPLPFPKHVAFKGKDGFLSVKYEGTVPYLFYVASTNSEDPTVRHEIFTKSDGSIRIKSDYVGKFWRTDAKWIVVDSDDTNNNNRETLFRPIKVDNNVYVLRSMSNNNLCKRLTDSYGSNCLAADTDLIVDACSHLELVDLVPNVCNFSFGLKDASSSNHMATTAPTKRDEQEKESSIELKNVVSKIAAKENAKERLLIPVNKPAGKRIYTHGNLL